MLKIINIKEIVPKQPPEWKQDTLERTLEFSMSLKEISFLFFIFTFQQKFIKIIRIKIPKIAYEDCILDTMIQSKVLPP